MFSVEFIYLLVCLSVSNIAKKVLYGLRMKFY